MANNLQEDAELFAVYIASKLSRRWLAAALRTMVHSPVFHRDREVNGERWHQVADRVEQMTRAERRVLIRAAKDHQVRLEKHIDAHERINT
jgi:hypothetical protein